MPALRSEGTWPRSEEHTSELQSRENLVCRLLLEKKKRGEAVEQSGAAGSDQGCRVAGERLFFFNDTATTEIYTLSLHDALPISRCRNLAFEHTPEVIPPTGLGLQLDNHLDGHLVLPGCPSCTPAMLVCLHLSAGRPCGSSCRGLARRLMMIKPEGRRARRRAAAG